MSDTTPRRRAGLALIFIASLLATNGIAIAQLSCAARNDPDRGRCEQAQRTEKACAGQTGEALAACRKEALEPRPVRRDCNRLPEGYGRNKCEDENLHAEIAARCGAKPGAEYDRCYAGVMAKAASK